MLRALLKAINYFFEIQVEVVTNTSGSCVKMSRGQLSFVLSLCGLKVGAGEIHRKKDSNQMVLMVVKLFEIGKKLILGNLTYDATQTIEKIHIPIITSEAKK